ncbi:hypothetical protein P5673_026427 [Acropora cervicornis]|uniref:Uncharacterized protein n=1 Tax=Acropora cervicornis TaxID=6130 RepID=A0AAD9Q0N1_ACRCE|nr:hypothetical protein P5673_026427 [Acropora cervicornis]
MEGKVLLELCVANTWFRKGEKRKVTYRTGGNELEIDFLLVGEGNRKYLRDVKVIPGGEKGSRRPFAVRDHVLGYCIATPYWRASTPVISDNIEITEMCVQTKNSADNKLKALFSNALLCCEFSAVAKYFLVNAVSEEEYLSSFRFRQLDIPYLAQVLRLPEKFICPNQTAALTEEALCILVRRFAYPCQYVDLTPQFGRSPQELSLIANKVMDQIYETHGHLVANKS